MGLDSRIPCFIAALSQEEELGTFNDLPEPCNALCLRTGAEHHLRGAGRGNDPREGQLRKAVSKEEICSFRHKLCIERPPA